MSTSEPTGTTEPASTTEPAAHADASEQAAAAHAEAERAPAPRPEDLRAAAGLGEQPPRRGRRAGPRRGRTILITAAVLLLAATVAGLVYLGQQNRRSYHLVCGAEAITAARGRGFPPWGQSALTGEAWRPIPVAPATPCTSQTLDSRPALAQQLGAMLVARAEAWVIGRRDGTGREQIAAVQAQLDQARLLLGEAAEPGAPAVAEGAGRALERLQGDVDYWHARDRVEAAAAALDEAAAQLDQAVAREPRHNSENAAAWQGLLARIRQDLASGPYAAQPGAAGAGSPGVGSAPGTDSPHASAGAPGTGAPGTAQDSLAPAGDAGAGSPGADAAPGLPVLPGTTVPPGTPVLPGTAVPLPAPRKMAPDAGVPRGGQLI